MAFLYLFCNQRIKKVTGICVNKSSAPSFKSIAIAQNTNLSVVAPGIAEALFATALGLFVAIPAVVAYNKISSDLSKYFISLETFMDEFTTIFFRQLEKK